MHFMVSLRRWIKRVCTQTTPNIPGISKNCANVPRPEADVRQTFHRRFRKDYQKRPRVAVIGTWNIRAQIHNRALKKFILGGFEGFTSASVHALSLHMHSIFIFVVTAA